MAEIQQWRRMIQPTRVRTPAVVEAEDIEATSWPSIARRPLKPTFTTETEQPLVGDQESRNAYLRRVPSWVTEPQLPNPSIEQIIDSIMCNVLQDPYSGLTAQFASDLMTLIEGYRNTTQEKDQLMLALEQEVQLRHALQQSWDRERLEYKAEVKRLELLLSEGDRGIAEVTIARQDSLLRRRHRATESDDGGLESILQVLEKARRHEDKTWTAQRATMRRKSPSAQMRRLSKSLASKQSKVAWDVELPPGTLPREDTSILDQMYNEKPFMAASTEPSDPTTSMSDDTSFSFGYAVDAPTTYVVNHNVDTGRLSSVPNGDAEVRKLPPSSTLTSQVRKTPSLKTKASGFLSRFKPQLHVEIPATQSRRFSFETGDDLDPALSAPVNTLPPAVLDRLLRKSASMSSLEIGVRQRPPTQRDLSPVAQSPITSAAPTEWMQTPPGSNGDERRLSKIPTPVYNGGTHARPRRERDRDDSSSSLLTAIRESRHVSYRSNSLSSSTFSSPSGSRIDLTQGRVPMEVLQSSIQRSSGGNESLPNHDNSLRGNAMAAAAARAAATNLRTVDQNTASNLDRRSSVQSSNNSRKVKRRAAQHERETENSRPMG